MKNSLKCQSIQFEQVGNAKVSFQKDPKGVIQFFGGYFFGTFPTYFYSKLLAELKNYGYTIVVFPYSLSSDHLIVAETLFEYHTNTVKELEKYAPIYKDYKKYFWVAHSLGCEYIVILKLLSDNDSQNINSKIEKLCQIFRNINENAVQRIFQLSRQLKNTLSPIGEQASVLIAPCFRPPTSLLQCIIRPTQKQTWDCIEEKNTLFHLTSVISFTNDSIAGSGNKCQHCTFGIGAKDNQKDCDVCFLVEKLNLKNRDLWIELDGNHMTPINLDNKINLAHSVVNFLNKTQFTAN